MRGKAMQVRETPKVTRLKISLAVFATVSMAFFVFLSLKFRPIADDYCYTWFVKTGILHSLETRYFSEGGNLFETFIVLAQTGFPLAVFGSEFGSFTAFWLTLASLGGLLYLLGSHAFPKLHWQDRVSLVASTTTLGWLTFWWLPALFPVLERMRPVYMRTAKDIVYWQSMTGQYVLVPSLLLGLAILSLKLPNRVSRIVAFSIIGICTGASSLILAGGALLVVATLIAFAIPLKLQKATQVVSWFFLAGTLSGVIFQLLAPGTSSRLVEVNQGVHSGFGETISRLGISLVQVPLWLGVELCNLGLVAAFAFGLIANRVADALQAYPSKSKALKFFWLFAGASLALLISEKVTQAFGYFALWHMTYSRLFLFLASLALGVYFGSHLHGKLIRFLQASALIVVILGSTYSAAVVATHSLERAESWPLDAVAQGDAAEVTASWVMECAVRAGLVKTNR